MRMSVSEVSTSDLAYAGVEALLREFAARRVSPVELLDALADRIEAVDRSLGGFTALCLERARDEARAAEPRWARGGRGAAGARERHGRLDPGAGRVLRRRRLEADLRPGQCRRGVAARALARPSGPDGADTRRRGATARGDRGLRRGRSGDRGRP